MCQRSSTTKTKETRKLHQARGRGESCTNGLWGPRFPLGKAITSSILGGLEMIPAPSEPRGSAPRWRRMGGSQCSCDYLWVMLHVQREVRKPSARGVKLRGGGTPGRNWHWGAHRDRKEKVGSSTHRKPHGTIWKLTGCSRDRSSQ